MAVESSSARREQRGQVVPESGDPTAPFSGVVLAGGRSSRMGRDKAMTPFRGEPLISRPLAALRDAGAVEVAVVGGDPATIPGLGVELVPDGHPGSGPLGGLLTALARSRFDLVVILACDLPLLRADAVRDLVHELDKSTASAVVPVVEGRLQPLTAAYRRGIEPRLREIFASGTRSVTSAVERVGAAHFHGITPAQLTDVDTPEQLERLEESLP